VSPLLIGAAGIAALLVLILAQVPIGIAMIIVGVVGYALQAGWGPALTILASEPSGLLASVDLATVPLFLLMGTFASAAGFSADIYRAAAAAIGAAAWRTRRSAAVPRSARCAVRPPPLRPPSRRQRCPRCSAAATRKVSRPERSPRAGR
jgi:hypothetical protein